MLHQLMEAKYSQLQRRYNKYLIFKIIISPCFISLYKIIVMIMVILSEELVIIEPVAMQEHKDKMKASTDRCRL